MRVGVNPQKNVRKQPSVYTHQVVIPIYIPNLEGYYQDALDILKLCIRSLLSTVHPRTYISLADNGCCAAARDYINGLLVEGRIHEVIHSDNIGKMNAVLKGIAGNDIELLTIADADVLFLTGWQKATVEVFAKIPKAGVVGLVPQIKTYRAHAANVIFDNWLSGRLRFVPVEDQEAFIRFYESIGWATDSYHPHLRETVLGLEYPDGFRAIIGSGHFVSTFKRDVFTKMKLHSDMKLGGDSEDVLDRLPLEKDYWRLTTYRNYAFHMGNTLQDWMPAVAASQTCLSGDLPSGFGSRTRAAAPVRYIKNKVFKNFIKKGLGFRMLLSRAKIQPDKREGQY